MSNSLRIAAIDALLPQTQCGKCGHPGCLPYAEGIAAGEAINKCPPGGNATIHALADLLQVPELPLALPATPPQVAVIREAECIGCTKCIQACPVDAIVGAAKLMHTVIGDECTGCELCIAPCPVDCIDLIALAPPEAEVQRARADQFRTRHQNRLARLARTEARRRATRPVRPGPVEAPALAPQQPAAASSLKQAKIDAAMSRAQLQKGLKAFGDTPDDGQRQQLAALQQAAERDQQRLAALQSKPAHEAPRPGEQALKQAKIDLASHRMALKAGERRGLDEQALAPLRSAYAAAQQALHLAEERCGKPAPARVLVDKAGLSAPLRQLKTDLAYARAELSKLQRSDTPEPAKIRDAQDRLAAAERRLQAHTSAS
ncbi:RnfABCDGE type electron transport complex subunit B [Pseudomonas argentinensis]|uniref:Electron transport complex protein RnfB n=1 Tax=Phytopseudomonas argentinensis TaxID=289370 RepID=A0A1I3HFF8_9GAMM|nr:RnfABCDGE type electron transport complex subunit B [Pseudomonas argentinensis]KAB0548447.1 RnfABCDGE type electron transport complex subunit B [Pseudomonas argentinensis]SFI34290.1 electron transport complex protein RnfB [Pseudomonas argentinensis]